MTCRHKPGDPDCGRASREAAEDAAEERGRRAALALTPDAQRYEIVQAERVGPHLVLKVRYPNCAACAYDGDKVMVYLDVTESDVLCWRRIDPHFRDPKAVRPSRDAPPPAARFPASAAGWTDALVYARGKVRP